MGLHLLALAAARGFLQAFFRFHGSPPPLLWPLNLWLPLARHLPEACAVLCAALAAHVAWLRRAYARGGTVWISNSRGRHGDDDEILRQALLNVSY